MSDTAAKPQPFWHTAAILVAASLLYCAPLFLHPDNLGREDWDQFTFRYNTPRVALLRDHVLPSWNPYSNGGTVLLAHPNSPVTSPWYVIVLTLGARIGLRVQVFVFMVIGAIGMAKFVTLLGASRAGAVAGGLVFMMSSHFALHITEGHLEWCVIGVMPWLAICLMRLHESLRYTIFAALLLASVLTFGAVYIPAVFLPFFSVWVALLALRARSWAPLVRWASVAVLAGLLASVKLLPMIQFTQDWPREVALEAGTPPRLLLTALFDPRQAFLYVVTRDHDLPDGHFAKVVPEAQATPVRDRLKNMGAKEGFHEYGNYVGLIGLLLAAFGLVRTARRYWPLYGAGICALLVVVGNSLPIDLWSGLRHLPLYGQLQVPSRFMAAVVFVLATAAALGVEATAGAFARWFRFRARTAALVLVLILAAELGNLGWRLFTDIFVVPPLSLEAHATFAHRYTRNGLVPMVMSSTMDEYLQSNSGTLVAYENMSVAPGDVRAEGGAGYRGEAYLESGKAAVTIRAWTVSGVTAHVETAGPDMLIVNQNFYRGWVARRRGPDGQEDFVDARATAGGLVAVPVDPRHTDIDLFYVPDGLKTGAWISGIALVICLVGLWLTRRTSAG